MEMDGVVVNNHAREFAMMRGHINALCKRTRDYEIIDQEEQQATALSDLDAYSANLRAILESDPNNSWPVRQYLNNTLIPILSDSV